MAKVILENIVKTFGKTEVVHRINACFNNGEFVVIVGPSGCGKSTILRMIAGLEEVSEGNITIGDRIVNNVEPKDRQIAMVFQNYALYPHMTVFNNMAYGLKLRKLSREEIKQRVGEAADLLQLTDFLKRKPRQLSGGQRQRVAMGRALVRKPSVFLFDEPLSNLDAKLRHQMRVELKKLHQRLGTTMIYVTHDQVEAMTLADKIVIINDGHIEQIGSPDEIYHDPASKFVAGFIGSPPMNFFAAKVVGKKMIEFGKGTRMTIENKTLPDKRSLVAGIRPEKIQIFSEKREGRLRLEVELIEKLGAGKLLYSHIGDQPIVVNIPDSSTTDLDQCWAELSPDNIYFFSSESHKRL
ncbi:MAG: sn-glycerol-3-phosphate ABC transporter ATP-binding protein UgpC [Desulfobacula sp.]|uniref:ABC transporter ATP-binding protein n=1 Tax=Desulfobacula sp. TaxID=2593537 RepID=UPI001E117759|nr:sn-glycerol-3-phosphate ABC transporter ATP-binding protein UgpC [Desulfobacula sp.]MBT3487655.1 sn-glycerol-3-phosphate ABC transporter ATP-binding protein UgpC [Desulfobacula sp.]MBT3806876.1 sn-glycerol-3-phosphate ABC transporter ATP-binding protein UgpC [Desulfobacula sp.]MBT4026982.1 sn-glycerol-3-phosphate ABC transporter ATP-binding protein UgpC [Desulfobacula sp.]MBT4199149.1 sn-glycerol-3-phosphate ABC transporter ATP-binding protein UgpC [Desulfobacula sp.]